MDPRSWFDRAVIYQVFVDRFYGFTSSENIPGFAGGTLAGVSQKLEYLKSLGIDVIWLSPFYETSSYHGYHITNFERVDPRFGSEEELRQLILKANHMGIRVVADFVPNHCSRNHPFFQHAITHQDSPYRKWFTFQKWPGSYSCFFDFKDLPKINLETREAREYILKVADKWLSLGLSGYRLDHVIGPSHKFWKVFSRFIRNSHPDAVLFGEAWAGGLKKKYFKTVGFKKKGWRKLSGVSQRTIQLEYHKTLDGCLDFYLRDMLKEAVLEGASLTEDHRLLERIHQHLENIPPDYHMVTFLDNHDMDRFIKFCNRNVKLLLEAYELLLSLDNPVVIYTGTENCLANREEITPMHPHSDLQVRAPMDWNRLNPEFVKGFRALVAKYRSDSRH